MNSSDGEDAKFQILCLHTEQEWCMCNFLFNLVDEKVNNREL